ncbi:MAG: hypothetical protein ACKV0T_17220 [Planctomycetales bacterium]
MNLDRLKKELETFEAHREELVGRSEGKFVLIQDVNVVGEWDTYEDALKTGYEKFGLNTPFLVKQITSFERALFFTRSLAPCQS